MSINDFVFLIACNSLIAHLTVKHGAADSARMGTNFSPRKFNPVIPNGFS